MAAKDNQTATYDQFWLPPYGILLQEKRHAPDFRMAEHYHHLYQVFYLLGGHGLARLGGRDYPVGADSVVFVPAEQPHVLIDQPDDPIFLFVLAFSADALGHHPENRQLLTTFSRRPPMIGPGQPSMVAVKERLRRILYEQTALRPGYPIAIRAELLSILLQLHRATIPEDGRVVLGDLAADDRPVHDVKRYLEEHYYEPLRVEAMARVARLSPRRLGERFKRLTGRTLIQYLTELRVREAKRLLTATDKEIMAVCFEVGYDNLSHFYRVFKKHTGLTPRRFRQEGGLP
ncbi:MAG TPA: AraC family transcriptional regulator [Bacillota bacterium]